MWNSQVEPTAEVSVKTHVVNIRLEVDARDHISRADLLRDLRELLATVQEQPPYRHWDGAGWWTNRASAVALLQYASVEEQMAADAEMRAEAQMAAEDAATMANG
jgi:hypothetical protein